MVSYGFASMSREFLQIAFNTYVFFYYETEIGLNVWLIGLGLIIFAVYNAINDPLIGYLTNKPFKFTKKWGRRFPLIMLGGIPMGISYFLVFTPPVTDPNTGRLFLFGWLIFTTCLFDTFHSLFYVNFSSLFPDKFRSVKERRTATGIQIPLGVIGLGLGSIIPPLFIDYGNLQTYIIQGIVAMIFGIVTMLIAIPGCREDEKSIEKYMETFEKLSERESFFGETKAALKITPFIAFLILYILYQGATVSMIASIPYVIRFILGMDASATTLIMAAMLIGTVVSVPLWVKLAHKTNDNRKIMLYSIFIMGIATIPLIFLESYIPIIITMLIWGATLGGWWSMLFPVMSDIIDESVVRYNKREEGTYNGILQFCGRLGNILQVLSFTIIHSLTGFVEGADSQSSLALIGIHIHLGLIPMIFMFLATLVFWKWYTLKPDRVAENQQKIKELDL
ncbi:MAG: MFS transporter [Candidatus Lokiarchaeota archaeon]|nr:MFS transporter [Candidatus Lokiarchaeota archaeon]MBD3340505.1 MFS transporter [Candidatus Lokiarchaeota archaeon]